MSNYLKELEVKESENGDLFFVLPDDLLDRLGWQEGDDLKFVEKGDGFMIKKVRYESVEIDLAEDDLFFLMKEAHANNKSFNEFVEQIIQERIEE